MIDDIGLGDSVASNMDSKRGLLDLLLARGKFNVEQWRDGKLIHREELKNGISDVGMNFLLDQVFRAQSGAANWYIGLVDNGSFSAFAGADTMGSHAGWIEFTAYSEGVRQTWTTVAASARSITNTVAATFSINGSGTLHGIFVTSNSTKGGTTGTLWSTGALAANLPVVNGDSIKITYTVSG